MAKLPRKPSTHSRASRRATSPALEGNLDKSIRNLPRPTPTSTSQVLAPRTGAGIAKKKGGKVLKRKQRARLDQGREKAEAVSGKLERKVERAEKMREGRKGRNADWDELNEKISGKKKSKRKQDPGPTNGDDIRQDEAMPITDTDGKPVEEIPLDVEIGTTNAVPTARDENSDAVDEIS